MKNYLLPIAFLASFIISCSSDDDNKPAPVPADYEKGILITNEGPFNNGSGTITYVSDDFATVEQKIYRRVNGSDLGNIVQSLGFASDDAYIVVSNSQKIMIANRYTFEKKDSIVTGLQNPRYFAANGLTKGYITDWGDPNDNTDDYVAVVDLRTNTISSSIPVSFGPEKILSHDGKIFVAHQGAYGHNNVVSVISGASVSNTITVGDAPNSMVVIGNFLYVMGGGKPDYSGNETAGSITKVDISTNQVVETFNLGTTDHPTNLTVDGENLFYNLNGKVYKVNSNAINLPGSPIIDGFFYAMEARNGLLYATDAGDFASRGKLLVFDLSNNQQIQDFQAGIVPGGIYFNN
ncbi:YncE family protein [Aequorivita sp. H23M31]|uniref:YncE family protein n=1 Tax=Aequorivita ciconiae TaxID=2494375 RepID=A0A410G7A9_9FLAO|nr:DUF5074 domain-containing protein [Aequorivita sp. H23M31]QAA83065.1 YncE family protein [Aequorivita sp. H23M31]